MYKKGNDIGKNVLYEIELTKAEIIFKRLKTKTSITKVEKDTSLNGFVVHSLLSFIQFTLGRINGELNA